MRANASKRRGENASKRKQTRANVDKRKQTLTPPFMAVFYTPLCNHLTKICANLFFRRDVLQGWPCYSQRAPNPPEITQPRLSRVKWRSSPARGYKFGCVCSYMAGHEDVGVMAGHIGTNALKFVPPRWGRPPLDPTQTGLCTFGGVWSSLIQRLQVKKLQRKAKTLQLQAKKNQANKIKCTQEVSQL